MHKATQNPPRGHALMARPGNQFPSGTRLAPATASTERAARRDSMTGMMFQRGRAKLWPEPEPPRGPGHYADMNATKKFAATLLIGALAAGCSSTSPNTQRGAVGGAVAGGALGAVIGHQSGEAEKGAAIGAAAGGIAGAVVGNQVDRRNERQSEADRRVTAAVRTPPPMPTSSPRETVPPRPSNDAVWVEGYWSYPGYGDQYQWVAGHWEVPPPGYRNWVGPTWERQSDGNYVYRQGHWR